MGTASSDMDLQRVQPSTTAPSWTDAAALESQPASAPAAAASSDLDFARQFLAYIDKTPTPFHLCTETIARLKEAGFTELSETEPWCSDSGDNKVVPGGKYYYTRNVSTIVAFAVGGQAGADGKIGAFKVVGAHTDSPVLKLKPCTTRTAHGYLQLNVETYGGGLWHTWFDRELTLAGSVIVQRGGKFVRQLVHVQRALMRVPTLCIHLQSADERKAFAPNKETHLQPIMSMIEETLGASTDERHSSELLEVLSAELGCAPEHIMDFDISLCDTQPGAIWGLNQEFLSSPRLDNQSHCWTSLSALMEYSKSDDFTADGDIAMIALFDHEEVGSDSAQGAGSPVFADAIARVAPCVYGGSQASAGELARVCTQKSFLVSADVAHAIHPNYASKHDSNHAPQLNKGTVLKTNSNQRYATNSVTGFILREVGRRSGAPTQEFVVRNDCPCGSTIGPIIASKTGCRAVDIGIPSLSMHSCRETCGVADIASNYRLLLGFFREYGNLQDMCNFECVECAPAAGEQ